MFQTCRTIFSGTIQKINRNARFLSIKPTTIVFDKDGTLLDAHETFGPLIQYACEQSIDDTDQLYNILGFNPDTKKFSSTSIYMKDTNQYVHEQLKLHNFNVEQFKSHIKQGSQDRSIFQTVPLTNIQKLFKQLRRKGFKIAILSADDHTNIEAFIQENNSLDLVDVIVGGDDGYNSKPDPEPLFHIAKALNVPIESVMMVGDSSHDICCAANAKTWSIGVGTGITSIEELRPDSDFVLTSVKELPLLIDVGEKHQWKDVALIEDVLIRKRKSFMKIFKGNHIPRNS